jgi:hypothetical protein
MDSEGLLTSVWGADFWKSLHNITYNYPYEPTEEIKKKYYNYFMSLGDVLPCCTCRKHYQKHINYGETRLTFDNLKNRDSLTFWLFNFHKCVCEMLGFTYDITYEMVNSKHNSYIANCDMTEKQKQNAYKNMYDIHAPIVRIDILQCIIDYANKRKINNFASDINKYSKIDRMSEEWYERNQLCQKQIKYMKINGKKSIETDGKYKGLFTIDELKLMCYTSTLLPIKDIKRVLKKMNCVVEKRYLFSK